MNKSIKNTFYRRFSLILVFSVVAISLMVIRTERLLLTSDLQDKGDSIARILSSVTLDAILSHEYATMERYAEDIVKEKFVSGIAVIREDGEILAGGTILSSPDILLTEHPIQIGAEQFGVVQIALSTSRIDTITWQIVFSAVAIIIVLHIFGLFLTNLVLNRTVLMPLDSLQEAIRTVSEGDFSTPVDLIGPTEFKAIGTSFNGMAEQLQLSFSEIQESRQTLDLERNKLAAIVASIADGMFVTDNDENIISFNKSASKISGYTENEALEGSCEHLFRTSLCQDACALRHAGETRENVETTMITKEEVKPKWTEHFTTNTYPKQRNGAPPTLVIR